MEYLHFKDLPSVDLILNSLRINGILNKKDEVDIELFEYSSYNPVFLVKSREHKSQSSWIVIRGEAQIVGALGLNPVLALQSEVEVTRLLIKNQVKVPALISDGKIFTIEHSLRGRLIKFSFFLMSYVPGIAIDNAMRDGNQKTRHMLLDQIATIYAKIHCIKRAYFGGIQIESNINSIDLQSSLINQKNYFKEFINKQNEDLLNDLKSSYGEYINKSLNIFDVYLKKYKNLNEASLVIFDGSAGNMLINSNEIALIDFDRSHYGCSLVDFCATLYCLEEYFFDKNFNDLYWNIFLVKYQNSGGWVPNYIDFDKLFPHIFIDFLMSSAIDGINHRLERKKNSAKYTFAEINKLIKKNNLTIKDVVQSIRSIKIH